MNLNEISIDELNPNEIANKTFNLVLNSIRWHNQCLIGKRNRPCNKKMSYKKTIILMIIYSGRAKTVSDLEEIFSTSGSSISVLLSKLVDDGYLIKELPGRGDDGRKIYFVITDKGLQVIKEAYDEIEENIIIFFNQLTTQQKKYYLAAIRCMNQVFATEGEESI